MGYFPVRYNSKVLIYKRKIFIRLATGMFRKKVNLSLFWETGTRAPKGTTTSFRLTSFRPTSLRLTYFRPTSFRLTYFRPINKGDILIRSPLGQMTLIYFVSTKASYQIHTSQTGDEPYSYTSPPDLRIL